MSMAAQQPKSETVLVTCPYNNNHVIEYRRLPYHITKCSKNYRDVKLLYCPYNSYHLFVNEEEFRNHVKKCEDRYLIDRTISRESMPLQNSGNLTVPSYKTIQPKGDDDEDWELEYTNDNTESVPTMPEPVVAPLSKAVESVSHSDMWEQASSTSSVAPTLPKFQSPASKRLGMLKHVAQNFKPSSSSSVKSYATTMSAASDMSSKTITSHKSGNVDLLALLQKNFGEVLINSDISSVRSALNSSFDSDAMSTNNSERNNFTRNEA